MFTLGTIEAFGLYVARTSALVLVSPILGEGIGMAGVKVALIAILSLLMFTVTGEPLPEAVAPFAFGVMAMREILIGLAVTRITQKAVELLGPAGYSKKLLVEKWMRDAKINDIYEGTQQINQLIVARRILDYPSSMLR